MICRRCLLRASVLRRRAPILSKSLTRPISTTLVSRNAATPSTEAAAPSSSDSTTPKFSSPLSDAASPAEQPKSPRSSCPEGTILAGLNYFKDKSDPVALADDAYPEWLWSCLDVKKKADDHAESDAAGDEFSKSKKQRRLAAKRQRALEAKLIAEGNLEALAPKIPLQEQSINLPGNEEHTTEGALAAEKAREDLRRAMRKERKAKIKESNYLKSM